jgi:transcriptional regulator with XRE-family HTH domain
LGVAKRYYKNEAGVKAFGRKLYEIRKKKGVTQEALAYATDLHLSQIGRIERGEVSTSISFVYLFAEVLGVKPTDFFEDCI